jgi:NAD-dependent SIR2 family protein deacetylase
MPDAAAPDSAAATPALAQLAGFLRRHPGALVLSGAGLSTASGIPAYRDEDGVRRGKAPIQGPEFRAQDAVRRRYWARSMVGWPVLRAAEPNPGHHAIAALAHAGWLGAVVTQNVDGLHRQAGSVDLVELHGNIHAVLCLGCRARFTRAFIQSLLEQGNSGLARACALPAPDGDAHLEPDALERFHVPYCPRCGGVLQPDVVFFGDGVPALRNAQATAALERAGALLVVGSSLTVASGYRLCRMAAEAGWPIAAVNRGKTRADALFSLKIEAAAEAALPALAALLSSP